MAEKYTLDFVGRKVQVGDYVDCVFEKTMGKGGRTKFGYAEVVAIETKSTCQVKPIINGQKVNATPMSGQKMSLNNDLYKNHPELLL